MTISLNGAIRDLLSITSPAQINSFPDWKVFFANLRKQHDPAMSALLGGASSPCVGYAFASGYQAALQSLTPAATIDKVSALCVTEEEGNHPRAIATSLTPDQGGNGLLTGSKKFITGGPQADILLVAATTGNNAEGRPVLKLVQVNSNAEGVQVKPMPTLPFVPEIEHASVSFEKVTVSSDQILQGDGYGDYVKPFRTVEDIHVTLALCGYLTRICREIQPGSDHLSSWLALVAQHIQLTELPPSEPITHLLLAGARQQLEQLIPELETHWQAQAPESFTLWQRDKALLKVAGQARTKRTETALRQTGLS